MNTQEKIFGYFTEDDWLEIKEHIKNVLKEDISNIIEEEYIFDAEYLRNIEKEHLLELEKEAMEEVIKEEGIDLENIIRQVIREELRKL